LGELAKTQHIVGQHGERSCLTVHSGEFEPPARSPAAGARASGLRGWGAPGGCISASTQFSEGPDALLSQHGATVV